MCFRWCALTDKKFPRNVRALAVLVLELLRSFVDDVTSFDELQEKLDSISQENILAEHWVKNLIRPVFLMMLFIRAEREEEFPLHLYACTKMLPYFFAAGHINYVRYGLCYLMTMSTLPLNILDKFLQREHVLRHKQGIWNGIWSDMIIETTFMKFKKGPTGIIGKTTSPRTIQIWANSQHKCIEVLQNLDTLRNRDEPSKLKNFLITRIHPLQSECDTLTSLCNIYTGQIAEKIVNVNKAVEIGKKQMDLFQISLPGGFRSKIKKEVVSMKTPKEAKKKSCAGV